VKTALQEQKNRKPHMHMLVANALELSVRMSTQHCDHAIENLLIQLLTVCLGVLGEGKLQGKILVMIRMISPNWVVVIQIAPNSK